jgi:hypothetical protein
MALSIDWPTKVVSVPKADLTLIQSNPIEVREMDLNAFHLELRDIEDDEEGMAFLHTHSHAPPVDVGGVTLARVVEMINGYTVTFEDGQYAVNLIGANSNVGDVVNVNQVSVRTGNSAGLVTSAAIEFGEYGAAVTIDVAGGETGTVYPLGTLRRPVNNIPDAMLIAAARGFGKINVIGDLTLDTGDDVEDMTFCGRNQTQTTLTINTGALTTNCEIRGCTVTGVLDGGSRLHECAVETLNYVNGEIHDSMLNGTVTLGGSEVAHLVDCHSGVPGTSTPTIDCGGSGQALAMRGYSGGIELINKTGSEAVTLDIDQGQIILDSTVTGGTIVCRGNAKLTDNSVGATVLDETVTKEAIWAYER